MRCMKLLAAPLICATGCWAQIAGPDIFNVVGGADYSSAASVGIPQGSIFTITGVNLTTTTVLVSSPILPTEISGFSVGIRTAGDISNVVAQALLLYISPTQINAILPSSVPVGQYEMYLTTTINPAGTSLPFFSGALPIVVTGGRFAAFTRQSRGFGPAAIQQYNDAGTPTLNQFTASAAPGAVMAVWGTGLGPLPAGSDASPPPVENLRNDVTVYVAGIPVKPLYAGRAPDLFGVDQIDFVLPTGIRDGCFIPLQVVTGTAVSATATISVAASGDTCPSEFGLSASTLASLDAEGTIVADVLSFGSTTSTPSATITRVVQTSQAWRAVYDASTLSVLATTTYPPRLGSFTCTYSPSPPSPDVKGLSQLAGVPMLSITGPSGCAWPAGTQFAGNVGNCLASAFSFGGVTDSLPQPRPSTVITAFSAQRSGEQLTTSWSVNANPNDSVSVTAGSQYSFVSPLGTGSQYYSAQSSCKVSPLASPFVFPSSDSTEALTYATLDPATMTLTDSNYEAYFGSPPADIVVLLTYNSATATAAVQ